MILQSGSQVDLVKHLKQTDLVKSHFKEREMKDLEYTLKSLRQRWVDEPEFRQHIEAEAETIKSELGILKQAIPRSLAEIGKDQPGLCEALVESMILNLSEFLNIGKNIAPRQIRETSELLCAEFQHLTLEHFAVVFHRAKLGQWGEIYDRLDGIVIAGWLRKYVEEIRQAVADTHVNKHMATKESRLNSGDTYTIRDITRELYKDKL